MLMLIGVLQALIIFFVSRRGCLCVDLHIRIRIVCHVHIFEANYLEN